MSRSRRHTPIMGFASASSDKWFKTQSARRIRRFSDTAIRRGKDTIAPAWRYQLDPYDAPKDGKYYFAGDEEAAKWMRK